MITGATRLDSLAKNATLKGNIRAHWQPNNKSFWYRNVLADSSREYQQVEAKTGIKSKITDATKLVPTKDNGIINGSIRSRWERQRPTDSLSPEPVMYSFALRRVGKQYNANVVYKTTMLFVRTSPLVSLGLGFLDLAGVTVDTSKW